MELIGHVMTYQWGKMGSDSIVAQIAALNSSDFKINEQTPYSELWMGDHSSGPSFIKDSGRKLGEVLVDNPTLIGGHEKLPFLFKVLSIRKALSIQTHPNKEQAEKLHAERPDLYPDDNHKPELAIALTPFVALCGFRPHEEICKILHRLPPIVKLLGGEEISKQILNGSEGLRKCFAVIMNTKEDKITECAETILNCHIDVLNDYNLCEVFMKLKEDFPADVGILAIFFLNLIRLQPGEAIFLASNLIHAYISGDCIECMACSDNVIRAGLTPKYKDVETLIASVNCDGICSKDVLFQPIVVDEFMQSFNPPVEDFAVNKIKLPSAKSEYQMEIGKHGGILLVLNGQCTLLCPDEKELKLSRGSIVFIPCDSGKIITLKTVPLTDTTTEFEAYMAT